ncbi:HAD family hydrolase [Paludisphaera mucosa]|uniref:HAD family phosphatase n=1 Tax=Paludisphaera mucosa TaxID=3030827 RepID=A0ABT6FBB8_9BACT|nr:HAD family phosphatase [Paludisphaera mucosa]MDG3004675.1 HAD family phosphatase [Paludisphaera mucosa]
MAPTAVLFDFDGVIADAENYHVAAWQRTLVRMGWEVADEVAARAVEQDDHAFAAELFADRGVVEADLDGWVRKKQELTVRMIRLHPRAYPGVAELFRALAGRTRIAVVSTTWRENVEALLEAAGLADAVELIVAKEDVKALKPAPDAYVRALKRLRVAASRAVAVEDSPRGLAAAEAAGLRRLAVGHRREAGDWVGDADFVPAFEPLADVLAQLGFPDRNPA